MNKQQTIDPSARPVHQQLLVESPDRTEVWQKFAPDTFLGTPECQQAGWAYWPLGLPLPPHAPASAQAQRADDGRTQ